MDGSDREVTNLDDRRKLKEDQEQARRYANALPVIMGVLAILLAGRDWWVDVHVPALTDHQLLEQIARGVVAVCLVAASAVFRMASNNRNLVPPIRIVVSGVGSLLLGPGLLTMINVVILVLLRG